MSRKPKALRMQHHRFSVIVWFRSADESIIMDELFFEDLDDAIAWIEHWKVSPPCVYLCLQRLNDNAEPEVRWEWNAKESS
jgi:hypothetical protein